MTRVEINLEVIWSRKFSYCLTFSRSENSIPYKFFFMGYEMDRYISSLVYCPAFNENRDFL